MDLVDGQKVTVGINGELNDGEAGGGGAAESG